MKLLTLSIPKPGHGILALVCVVGLTYTLASITLKPSLAALIGVLFFCSAVMAHLSCGIFRLNRLTIPGFWYLTYLPMIFLPALFVYAQQEGPYRNKFLFAVVATLFTVPCGWILANFAFRYSRRDLDRFYAAPLRDDSSYERLKAPVLCMLVAASLLTVTYVAEVKTIPLFYLISHPGDYLELVMLREEAYKLLDSPFIYLYFMLRAVLFPFLIAVTLGCYLRSRQIWWLAVFLCCTVLGLFFASLTIAKAPVSIIVAVIGFFVYLYRGGKLGKKLIACLLILVLAFPLVVILGVSTSGITFSIALGAILSRIFYMPAEVVYYYFEVFPSQMHFLHGTSIDKLAHLLGEETFPIENFVGRYAYPQYPDTVAANGAFFAYFYADFGMTGVLISGLFAGFLMQGVSIWLVRQRKSVITLAAYAFMFYAFWFLHSVSLTVVIASNGVVAIMLLVIFLSRRYAHGFSSTSTTLRGLPGPAEDRWNTAN